jgi:hypothetical protein
MHHTEDNILATARRAADVALALGVASRWHTESRCKLTVAIAHRVAESRELIDQTAQRLARYELPAPPT